MISTSNNPVSPRIASLPDGIPNRKPKRERYLPLKGTRLH